uniref:Uncharacterized protein n=1 Tax=Romanomermis culicivorax TaxID=13658 RepID=A0A915KXE8_ROMCU
MKIQYKEIYTDRFSADLSLAFDLVVDFDFCTSDSYFFVVVLGTVFFDFSTTSDAILPLKSASHLNFDDVFSSPYFNDWSTVGASFFSENDEKELLTRKLGQIVQSDLQRLRRVTPTIPFTRLSRYPVTPTFPRPGVVISDYWHMSGIKITITPTVASFRECVSFKNLSKL